MHKPLLSIRGFGNNLLDGKYARVVQVQPGIEKSFGKRVERFGVLLREMATARVLSDRSGILATGRRVVVTVAGA